MALSADRNTVERGPLRRDIGVAASTIIYTGALVAINAAGYLVPFSASTTLVAVGVARATVDNSAGANGAATCPVDAGIFKFDNSAGGEEITIAHVGDTIYGVDDEQVGLTDATGTLSAAGVCWAVDSDGVLVKVGL
jgi:hypothetical protein